MLHWSNVKRETVIRLTDRHAGGSCFGLRRQTVSTKVLEKCVVHRVTITLFQDLGRNLLPAVAGSVPIPPVHSQSGILPDRERASHFHPSPNTVPASPTLQARLQVNSEKRQPTLRREPRPPSPSVSPSPSPSPTTSQETARVSSPSAGTTTSTPISAANVVTGAPAQLSCSGKIGYFSDPTPAGCDAFLYCDQFGRSYRFLCPQGTHFNSRLCLCDLHSPCVDGKEKVSRLISPDDPCPPLLADGR